MVKKLRMWFFVMILLLTACTAPTPHSPPPVDTSTPEVEAAYADYPVLENGQEVKFRVGMRVEDFKKRTGFALEDGWYSTVKAGELAALSVDGVVRLFSVAKDWHVLDGAAVGDTREEVVRLCGEPDEEQLYPPPPRKAFMGMLTYYVAEPGGVWYQHKGDGVISGIFVSAIDLMGNEPLLEGYQNALVSGSGKQTVVEFSKYNVAGEYLLISYAGKGTFELIATGADGKEKVLVSEKGPYEGRVEAPGFAPYGLRIRAKGDWQIKARVDYPLVGPMETLPS